MGELFVGLARPAGVLSHFLKPVRSSFTKVKLKPQRKFVLPEYCGNVCDIVNSHDSSVLCLIFVPQTVFYNLVVLFQAG